MRDDQLHELRSTPDNTCLWSFFSTGANGVQNSIYQTRLSLRCGLARRLAKIRDAPKPAVGCNVSFQPTVTRHRVARRQCAVTDRRPISRKKDISRPFPASAGVIVERWTLFRPIGNACSSSYTTYLSHTSTTPDTLSGVDRPASIPLGWKSL
jgi:hypothetical protein